MGRKMNKYAFHSPKMEETHLPEFVGMIANQRSGTHLLRGGFNSHPDVFCPAEPMYRCSPTTKKELEQWLGQFWGLDHKVIVLDIKYDQITPIVETFLGGLRNIHLIRRDMKRMFLSLLMWQYYTNAPEEEIAETERTGELRKMVATQADFEAYCQQVKLLQAKFSYLGDLEIFYEDLTEGGQTVEVFPQVESLKLCRFLDVALYDLVADTSKETPNEVDQYLELVEE